MSPATSTFRPGPLLRTALRIPAALYDWDAGWLLTQRFLRLTHVGRRSGRAYRTVLEVFGHSDARREVMVMVGFGRGSDWYRNLQARPALEVVVGRYRFVPVARELPDEEAARVVEAYLWRNRFAGPLVRRVVTSLSGRPFDGSPEAIRALVRDLPVIAFRPAEPLAGP